MFPHPYLSHYSSPGNTIISATYWVPITIFIFIEGKPVQYQVPQEVSDSWLRSLKLIDVPKDSLHYLGRELVATLKELEQKMERDDPTEEYKVKLYPGYTGEIVCDLNLFIIFKNVHKLL